MEGPVGALIPFHNIVNTWQEKRGEFKSGAPICVHAVCGAHTDLPIRALTQRQMNGLVIRGSAVASCRAL